MTSAPPTDVSADREVSLSITRDPSLVRTVRLVAASIARRAGLDASAVEEVRLAVGETCAVMVGALAHDGAVPSTSPDPGDQVTVSLRIDAGLVAEIQGPSAAAPDGEAADELADLALDPWALVRGLRDDVEVVEDGGATRVRLTWSA